jgi:hypothetical protein
MSAAGGAAPSFLAHRAKPHADVERDVDTALVRAAGLVLSGADADAAGLLDAALAAAPPGTSAGWLLPVEPLLNVSSNPDAWTSALARLRARSA